MTVFVVSKPKPGPQGNTYDISPAQEYGDIRFIFDAYENPSSDPLRSLHKVRDVLDNEYNSSRDYLVAAGGDPYGLFLVGYVLGELGRSVRWLRFERLRGSSNPNDYDKPVKTTGYYIPVEMITTSN